MTAPRNSKTTRRRFLIWGAAAGVAALGIGALCKPAGFRSLLQRLAHARQSPQSKLIAYFAYLKISEDVADHFVADYRKHVHDVGRLSELDDDFYTRFLLSTDFFQNGADESRALGYVAIYGPTITNCYNPLAKLD
jgi:hypothetical protein